MLVNMRKLRKDHLQRDRHNLTLALQDIRTGKSVGVPSEEVPVIEEMLILRIAQIDRLLGDVPS
jgi:hypothetical protein